MYIANFGVALEYAQYSWTENHSCSAGMTKPKLRAVLISESSLPVLCLACSRCSVNILLRFEQTDLSAPRTTLEHSLEVLRSKEKARFSVL